MQILASGAKNKLFEKFSRSGSVRGGRRMVDASGRDPASVLRMETGDSHYKKVRGRGGTGDGHQVEPGEESHEEQLEPGG